MEINEFVRYEGELGKIIDFCEELLYEDGTVWTYNIQCDTFYEKGFEPTKTNHSKDIIDLICLDDVIEYQFKTAMETSGIYRNVQIVDYETIDSLKKGDIQLISILTHEQFTQNAYVLEKER